MLIAYKISHKLVSENQAIVSEDLSVSNMAKNHNLAKAISDCGWYEITRQISYKSDWNNRQYIKIGRFTKIFVRRFEHDFNRIFLFRDLEK